MAILREGCERPKQPHVSDSDALHPRYSEYRDYVAAMDSQLVTALSFPRWLEGKEKAECGCETVFEVTDPGAALAPGWYKHVFGPGHQLLDRRGPYSSQELAARS